MENLSSTSSEYYSLKLEQDPDFDYNLLQNEQGKDMQLHKSPLFAFDTDSLTLYLKYIPKNIRR